MPDTARPPQRPSPAPPAPATPALASPTVVARARRMLTGGSPRGAGQGRGRRAGGADRAARLPAGDRLDRVVEGRVDEYRRQGRAGRHALEAAEGSLTYEALDGAANRLARFLRRRRVGAGDRVAVLLARPTDALTAQLALTKIGAVWVPLDAGLPDRSLAAVLAGSGAGLVITTAAAAPRLALSDVDAIYLDRVAARVAAEDARRPTATERGTDPEAPAYVVVHADAGPHGAALGLRAPAVGHPAVTNLVRVAAAVLDIGETDRVHHDPHTGSDLAVLETWVPWACGATVVTAPAGADLRGPALGRFLAERGITVLRADPARLAGIDVELPRLRLLVLTGPDRPHDVVARWQRPGRRVVGLHGPPEATVAAFWSELTRPGPDRDATWGRPLPTYGVVVLDPDDPRRLLGPGAVGELGVTGPGVARGYVGREDLTREAFVDGAASGPVFRTGELGRLTRAGEVERITRLDRAGGRGARVRPLRVPDPPRGRPPNRPARTSVMRLPDAPPAGRPGQRRPPTPPTGLAAPTVAMPGRPATPPPRAPATPAAPIPAVPAPAVPAPAVPAAAAALLATVLAEVLGRDEVPPDAHFFDDLGADSLVMARFCAQVRKQPDLPAVAMQDVYQHPTLAGLAAALAPAPAAAGVSSGARARLAALLGGVIGRDEVPPDAHFFDDLGADSLVMARFCAQVRKQPDLPAVAMQDVYQHPTLASLATALGADAGPAPGSPPDDRPEEAHGPRAGTAAFVLCGLAQLACFVAYAFVTALFAVWAFAWTTTAPDAVALYLRALAVGVVAFAGPAALAVVAKWTLIGRWRPGSIRVWSPGYLRFWLVKTLVRTSPVVLFAGTPIHTAYLRLLGARIGPGAVLLPRQTPVCTDLISVGAGTIVRKDAVIAGYRAHDGRIEIGGVSLGDGVVVGESTVLDVRTSLGDGASLHHGSSLHPGQSVPAGEAWHGSPGRRADAAPPAVPPAECGARRRVLYGVLDLALSLLVLAPLGVVVLVTLYRAVPALASLLEPAAGALATPEVVLRILALTAALYAGALLLGLLIVSTVPRLLGRMLTADRVYPLYGPHYWLHQAVVGMTNVKPFVELFGDSSAIAHYLSAVGYRLRPLTQTGSNFGMAVKHENPFLTTVGANTVVADGLSVMNADYSATSFRLSHTTIGANNFLGNRIAYPPQGRTGDDCLLGTKVAVPVAGPVLTGVGLLGSPSFTIPRGVARDSDLEIADPAALAASLRRKNRHNGVSMALHVLVRWLFLVLSAFLVVAVASLPIRAGAWEVVAVEIGLLLLTVVWFSAVERGLSRLKAWAPDGCSIYDPAFWRHERYWKVPAPDWMQLFNGTPFKAWVWRLLGVRIGARVFDDGANLTEKAFTTIGDDATLGEGAVIQCHSQEDGAFKSDHVVIGARVTLGVGSFVHYGTTIGDDAVLAPDTFLMKGEEVPSGERWGGNPARPL